MKKLIFVSLAVMCIACTGTIEPLNTNPGGGQEQPKDENPGGGPQDVNPPVDPTPISPSDTVAPVVPVTPVDPAGDEDTSEDNVANTTFDGEISITFNGADATVSGEVDDVSIQKNGAHVTVTNAGNEKVKYILSGISSDGCFKLYSSKKQAIVLSGLSLTNPNGAAINNQSKKRTFIIMEGANTLQDGSVNASGDYPEETSDEDMKAVMFSEGQLAFSGTGSLTVNAVGKAGITSDDYVHFLTGSNVTVNSSKGHGVRGKDEILVSGGTVNVTLESAATGKKCFSTDSLMYMSGGVVTLVNKASAGMVEGELTGAACIKADQAFVIDGGELCVTSSGSGCKCISGDNTGYFVGGKVVAKSTGSNYGSGSYNRYSDSDNSVSAKAIKFDGNLVFSGAEVSASSSAHEAIESKGTITISAGLIDALSSDDAINSSSTMTITGGMIYACSTGNDGMDANGNLIISDGFVFATGCGSPEVGIDANTEGGYKLYLQGGNVIALSGIESNSSVSHPVISATWNRNTLYSLCNENDVLFSFRTPSSGGTGLFISSPLLVKGTGYYLKSGVALSGAEQYFDGILSTGGTASGGSSTSVTASDYSSSGNNPGGGGPGGPGGPVGPGRH